jgi:hypothetical protein
MLQLAWVSDYQCDLSSLGGYQFANQGISYLLTLVYTFQYNQHLKHIVMSYLL